MIFPSTLQIADITFHTYGLIIGIAIVVAITLIEKEYKKLNYSESCFWKIVLTSLFFGVIGARTWHVVTDFYLYKSNLLEVFYLWNGGLGIFGGVLGGVLGLYLALKYIVSCKLKNAQSFFKLLDIAVFGLPFGQAIGRLGNYVNQELYGLPIQNFTDSSITSMFKVYILPQNRLFGYENIEFYHPLFFYEMVAMLGFGGIIHFLNSKKMQKLSMVKLPKIGTGKLFFIYLLYYSLIRFFLDFLRIDKVVLGNSDIGINQVIMVVIITFSTFFIVDKYGIFKKVNIK